MNIHAPRAAFEKQPPIFYAGDELHRVKQQKLQDALVVTINGGRRERTQTTTQPGGVSNPYAGTYVQSYEEGTLIIDIYDANRNMLVWHGWARAKVEGEVSTELVVEAVQKILERFPPQES